MGGLWGSVEESSLRVGVAEMRRREDVYLGFCIAALVGCCENNGTETHVSGSGSGSGIPAQAASSSSASLPSTSRRSAYVIQLQAVVFGKGAKSQRRLTTRSRLRAAFALQLIQATATATAAAPGNSTSGNGSGSGSGSAGPSSCKTESGGFEQLSSNISTELPSLIPFIYCLSELHETRLPCSEEVLMEALTSLSSPSQNSTKGDTIQHARTDARLLVRTWLHDEGCHREVRAIQLFYRTYQTMCC